MTVLPNGALATGLYWHSGRPVLTLTEPGGERELPVPPGTRVGWRLSGPRRCTGIWLPGRGQRRGCPHRAIIDTAGVQAQCLACAGADPGRALARDAALSDPRMFALYLAWFGPGLLKVGLTASERGADRLAEQGALAFTWLGSGRLLSVRRAERVAAATGVVRERIHRNAKIGAWWRAGDPDTRRGQLAAAHKHLSDTVAWPDGLHGMPIEIRDLTGTFGLTGTIPRPAQEITGVDDGSILAGKLVCLAGRDAVLYTAGDLLLIDLRLLSGWTVASAGESTSAVALAPFAVAGSSDDPAQAALF